MALTSSATRDLLTRLKHRPRRQWGQNFLIDPNIVAKSLQLAEVSATDQIVEIGPGLGTLTAALLDRGAQVWAIELDANLANHLRRGLGTDWADRFHLLQGDALDHPLAGRDQTATDFKIVANLPYAISTPWLEKILQAPLPARMVLMLQREAAVRWAARPGSKQFGSISIFLQSAYAVAPGHKVSAACFFPQPEVESYLFHLVRHPAPFLFATAQRRLIRECFQQRRKQIGSLLRGRLPDNGDGWIASLAREGLDHRARPEAIPVSAWQRLKI